MTAEVTIVGPGRMGCGIAQVFATNGRQVCLLDVKDRPRDRRDAGFRSARETIRSNLEFLGEVGAFEGDADRVLGRISETRSLATGLEDTSIVFEALPEDPEIKTEFFGNASGHLPPDAILATTTSSISLDTLSTSVPDPGRFLITHWLNPAFIVPLVEVARAEYTADAAVETVVELLEGIGKQPVTCRDSPGFIGSRVQAAAMNEAIRAYEDGVATPTEIDRALRTGVGFRMAAMGLIEFVDLGGVDILHDVNEYLSEELGPRFDNPDSVREKIEGDELGPRTGQGYYDYESVDANELLEARYERMIDIADDLAESER